MIRNVDEEIQQERLETDTTPEAHLSLGAICGAFCIRYRHASRPESLLQAILPIESLLSLAIIHCFYNLEDGPYVSCKFQLFWACEVLFTPWIT